MSSRLMDPPYMPLVAAVLLTRHFDAGGQMTAPEVAGRWDVSLRTAQRWLARLEQVVPLSCEEPVSGHALVWRKFGVKR